MSKCHPGELKQLAGGLLVSRLVLCSVKSLKTGSIYTSETREQANSKGAKPKGIIKINFPIQKMSHTH